MEELRLKFTDWKRNVNQDTLEIKDDTLVSQWLSFNSDGSLTYSSYPGIVGHLPDCLIPESGAQFDISVQDGQRQPTIHDSWQTLQGYSNQALAKLMEARGSV